MRDLESHCVSGRKPKRLILLGFLCDPLAVLTISCFSATTGAGELPMRQRLNGKGTKMTITNTTNTPRKQILRSAIRQHADWPAYRTANKCNLGEMTMVALEAAYIALHGRPLDGSLGTPGDIDLPDTDTDTAGDDDDDALETIAKTLAALQQRKRSALTEARVVELVKQHAGAPATVNLTIQGVVEFKLPEAPMHHAFPALLAGMAAGVNIMLVGPAGSGKTTAAHMAATAMGRRFAFTGALSSEYKLTGFIDAQGRIVRTPFREMYEHGGFFLFDEMDGSLPAPCLTFNAALANGHADFPDGAVTRHPDFGAIAACNTYGRGADRQYVGRNQLDAATLDRWAVLPWDYDTGLENAMLGLPRPSDAPAPIRIKPIEDQASREAITLDWTAKCRQVRAAVELNKVRHVVSPRALMTGVKLLVAGWPEKLVQDAVLYKGLDADTRAKIGR